MATFADLDPLPYFGEKAAASLRAVGWLGPDRPFQTGPIANEVYRRLRRLLKGPFQPFVAFGIHTCELCQHEGEASGGANLFVPAGGVLYVCPELILHYVNAHGYRPPAAFCEAVMACPDTRSMEYKRLFLENGGRNLMRDEDVQVSR